MSIPLRIAAATTASVLALGGAMAVATVGAPSDAATSLTIDDTADILDEQVLEDHVDTLAFHQPTAVAVYTVNGGEEALYDDNALNDAVLEHARTERAEWLSPDGNYWADSLYIFAVDPEGRLVGTYFGEDIAPDISPDDDGGVDEAIQDEARPLLGGGMWTSGTRDGLTAGAELIGRPWYAQTWVTITLFVLAFAVVGVGIAYVVVGMQRAARTRAAKDRGDAAMAEVVRDYDATEEHATRIPAEARYGGLMLQRHDAYRRDFRTLTDLGNRAREASSNRYDEKATLALMEEFRDAAVALDALDDAIADSASLLTLDEDWAEAWERQAGPLAADLGRVDDMIEDLPKRWQSMKEAEDVRVFADQGSTAVAEATVALEERRISPDDALDRLRDVRLGLTQHLERMSRTVAKRYKTYGNSSRRGNERTIMRDSFSAQRAATVDPSILGASKTSDTWFTVAAFRSAFESGNQQVQAERARHSSSSGGGGGGSTSGYTPSSGGSFSGSGSSSRF